MEKSSEAFKMSKSDQKYQIYSYWMSLNLMQIYSQNYQANYMAVSITSVPILSFFTLWLLKPMVLAFEDTQWANLQVTQPFKVPKSDHI